MERKKFGKKIREILSYNDFEKCVDKFEVSRKDEKKRFCLKAAAVLKASAKRRVWAKKAILMFKDFEKEKLKIKK
jgi:hypothetical protein